MKKFFSNMFSQVISWNTRTNKQKSIKELVSGKLQKRNWLIRNTNFNIKEFDSKITIATKLYTGFFVTILFFMSALGFAFAKTQQINHINDIIQDQSEYTMEMQRIQYHVHQQLASIKEWTLTGSEKAFNNAQEAKKASQQLEQQLLLETNDQAKKDKLMQIIKADKLISSIWEIKLGPMVRDGHYQVAYHSMVTEDQPIFEQLLGKTDKFVEINKKMNQELQRKAQEESQQAVLVVAAFGFVATILGVACSLLVVNRFINRPLKEVMTGARRIAKGDLTSQIEVGTKDEMGMLANVFNEMVDQLNQIISQLVKYGADIGDESEKLLRGSKSVSNNINMINEIFMELASSAKQEAESAGEALYAAVKAEHTATKGNEAVNLASAKMTEINEQSKLTVELVDNLKEQTNRIKQMLDVVNGIAKQTNLLSLNASIEAARAGEYGRGFAVVANEVRQLADDSSKSVKEITEVIYNIQINTDKVMEVVHSGAKQATEGVVAIKNTGKAFDEITESVKINANMVKQISEATEQVSDNIDQVAASTQHVTSNIDEVASTSQLLDGIAEKLQRTVNNFKV